MYTALALFLAAVVVWICGTLPWVIVNLFVCRVGSEAVCPDAAAINTQIRQILALDLILMIMAGLTLIQLRQHPFRLWSPQRRRRRRRRRSPE